MSRSLGITVNAPASQLKGRAAIIVIAVALSLAFAWRCHAGEEASEGGARIVAIGDVHGDLEDFRRILEATGLADSFGNWTGGSATLVQTGDLVERGTKVREVLDLTMSLQQQAPLAGGEVVVLLGNHEVNNLLGYLDYQSTPSGIYSEIFASFADSSSVDRQKRALKQWSRWRTQFTQCGRAQNKQEWVESHPPGYVEYFEAISPTGQYGRWLRSLPAMVRRGSTLFAHGGPSPWLTSQGLDSVYTVNRAITREIEEFDRTREYLIEEGVILPFFTLSEIHCAVAEALVQRPSKVPAKFQIPMTRDERARLIEIRKTLPNVDTSLTLRSEGPLWYRGYARLDEKSDAQVISDLLEAWRVDNIVVAHTPQKGQVQKRFGNVFLIDTGMVFGPKIGGQASALEISESRRFTAVYDDSDLVLADRGSDPEHSRSQDWNVAARRGRWLSPEQAVLPFSKNEEIEEFLRTATIVSNEEIPSGTNRPRKLLLEQYGIRAHAIFRHFEAEERNKRLPSGEVIRFFSDSYRNEAAAYEVARLVGLDHLYPAVRREVQGRKGSVQLWVEGAVSERERLAANSHPPSIDAWLDQGADMRVFDNLINNFDRNQGNILVDPDWKIWLIDHTRSFGREQQIPDPQYLERCSHELWAKIRALDEETVRRHLGPHLSEHEIDAFLARKGQLIEALETRIAELGEEQVLFRRGQPADPGAMRLVDSDVLAPTDSALPTQQ